jgi:hypothetical protein
MLSVFKLARLSLACAATLSTVACDDELGLDDWTATPDTVTIYSLSRPELFNQPSAYDFVNHAALRVESPAAEGDWDMLLRDENGQLALVSAAAFQGLNSRAALTPVTNASFDELAEAPDDDDAYTDGPFIVQPGQVYAVRTRRAGFCNLVRFAKMRVLDVDQEAGSIRFVAITNPFCADRELIPPED